MAVDPVGYIFGGTSGVPTYEELKRRRAIAVALASRQRGFPKTVGEGLTYLGESIGDTLADRRLTAMEREAGLAGAANLAALRGASGYEPGTAPASPAAPRPPTSPSVRPRSHLFPRGRHLRPRLLRQQGRLLQSLPSSLARRLANSRQATPSSTPRAARA